MRTYVWTWAFNPSRRLCRAAPPGGSLIHSSEVLLPSQSSPPMIRAAVASNSRLLPQSPLPACLAGLHGGCLTLLDFDRAPCHAVRQRQAMIISWKQQAVALEGGARGWTDAGSLPHRGVGWLAGASRRRRE